MVDMRLRTLTLLTITIVTLAGCERAADISSPEIYERQQIRFSYPGNWDVTEDATEDIVRYLFVETPGDAIFIAQIYKKEDAVTLNEYAKWFSEQSKQETPFGDIGGNSFSQTNKKMLSGTHAGIKETFAIKLFGETVPHVREYYSVETDTKVAFLISQTATEDLAKVEPGFDLIYSTFDME
jgi:hypothetical protein